MTRNQCRSGHFAAALQSEFGASHRRNDAPLLVHARGGEGGDIRPGFAATPETLGRIRRAGDEAAWRVVGRLPNRHVWLGYGDGDVDRVPFEELADAVQAVLVDESPTVSRRWHVVAWPPRAAGEPLASRWRAAVE